MYEIFEKLCETRGITPYKFCKETGVNSSTISTWKKNNSLARPELAKKVCDYFGVSMDYLMAGKESVNKEPVITPKDERDIAKDLNNIMSKIESGEAGPLHYNGQTLDEESLSLLKDAMNLALRQLKVINKEKYNPNKYKNEK